MKIDEQARCCKEFMGYVGGLDFVCRVCGTKVRLTNRSEETIEVDKESVIPRDDSGLRYVYV